MKDKKTPQYRIVYEQLRKHILTGIYQEGDILPSENELCVVNSVTRPTVRKALDMLASEGFIKKHQGKGSVVRNKPRGIGILSVSGTTSALSARNLRTDVIVQPQVMPWPADFMFELSEVERESGCIYFERIRFIDDTPLFYDITYLPNINLPRFTSRQLKNASLFDTLRTYYHLEIIGGEQYFKAMQSDEIVTRYLNVKEGHPVLNLQRKMDTNRIDFYVYSNMYCNNEVHSLYGQF